jgi:hypothetical protein
MAASFWVMLDYFRVRALSDVGEVG